MAASFIAPYSSSFRFPPQLSGDRPWSHYTPENPNFGRQRESSKAGKYRKKPKQTSKVAVHEPTTALEADHTSHANSDQNNVSGNSEGDAIVIDDAGEPAGSVSDSEFETISQIMDEWSKGSDMALTDPAEQRLEAPRDTNDSAASRVLDVSTVEMESLAMVGYMTGTTDAVEEPMTDEGVAGCATLPRLRVRAHEGSEMSDELSGGTDMPVQPRVTSTASVTNRKRSSSDPPGSPSSPRASPSASQQSSPRPLHDFSHKRPRLSSHSLRGEHASNIGNSRHGSISMTTAPVADPVSGKGEDSRVPSVASHERLANVSIAENSSSDSVSASHCHAAAAQEHDCVGEQHPFHDSRNEMHSLSYFAPSAEPATLSSRQSTSQAVQEQYSQSGNSVGDEVEEDGEAEDVVITAAERFRHAGSEQRACSSEDVRVERVGHAFSVSVGVGSSQATVASAGVAPIGAKRAAKRSRLAGSASRSAPGSVQSLSTRSHFDAAPAAEAAISNATALRTESRVVNGQKELQESATRASLSSAEFSLQRVHSSTSFLSTVVHADSSTRALSYQRAVALIREELGDDIRVEHLAKKQLPDGAVHLTAYVCDASITSPPSAATLPTTDLSTVPAQSESVKIMPSSRKGSRNSKKVSRPAIRRHDSDSDSAGSSDSDDDWPVRSVRNSRRHDSTTNDEDKDEDEDEDGDEDESSAQGDGPVTGKRGRWTPEDDARLRQLVGAKVAWPCISIDFPNRTLSAVKQHWGVLSSKSK